MSTPATAVDPRVTGVVGAIRSPGLVWLFSVLTLGIYYLVWYYKINKEIVTFYPVVRVSPGGAVVTMTLGSLILIPPLVSTVNTGSRIATVEQAGGLPPTCSGGIGLLLFIVFGLNTVYYQGKLNRLWEYVESTRSTTDA